MKFQIFLIISGLGTLTGLFFYYVLKKHIFGHLWGAIITGIIGAYIGHYLLDGLLTGIFTNIFGSELKILDVNLIAALIGSFALVWILSRISP